MSRAPLRRVASWLAIGALVLSVTFAITTPDAQAQDAPGRSGCERNTFRSYHDQGEPGVPPQSYQGPVFELSQDYPDELPPTEDYPWLDVDISDLAINDDTAFEYIDAMYAYMTEGNIEVGWDVQKNQVRPWYHAPWLDVSEDGREFTHGLTHELDSAIGQLGPQQTEVTQTWAVGAYNDRGGWAMGQIWCDPNNPDPDALNPVTGQPNWFPNGTAVWKLLFTTADNSNAPFLEGSLEWLVNIFPKPIKSDPDSPANPGNAARVMKEVRLIQMDVAVRDDRLPLGWMFGTFAYHADGPGDSPFEKMTPVGLQWGNDPGVTPQMVEAGRTLTQTWINERLQNDPSYPVTHLGWAGRLSGPLDDPESSCMSCHQTAGSPTAPLVPEAAPWFQNGADGLTPERSRLAWFANSPAGVPFSDTQRTSVDYSLQTSIGLQRFYLENCRNEILGEQHSARGPAKPSPALVAEATCDELSATVERAPTPETGSAAGADSSGGSDGPGTATTTAVAAALGIGVAGTQMFNRWRRRGVGRTVDRS